MADYADLCRALEKGLKRFYYLCGEPALVEASLDRIRQAADVDDLDRLDLEATGKKDSETEIWSALNQRLSARRLVIDDKVKTVHRRRLVVVRSAQKVKTLKPLTNWLADASMASSVIVVFEAGRDKWPTNREPAVRDKIMKSSVAYYVECFLARTPPPVPWKEEAAAYAKWADKISQTIGLEPNLAVYLFERVGRDVSRAMDTVKKLTYFKGEIGKQHIDLLAPVKPGASFVDSLMRQDKKAAQQAAHEIAEMKDYKHYGEILKILTGLELRLTQLGSVVAAEARGDGPKEMIKNTGLHFAVISEARKVAKMYDPKRRSRCYTTLAVLEEQVRTNYADEGVLEHLVALW